jgi:hypothetical protein
VTALKETLSNISHSCEGSHVNLGEVADSIEAPAFGILLLLPALIVILPISIIPGVSSLCAAVAVFTGCHILFGREALWLPERIRNIYFNGNRMTLVLGKMNTVAKKMDRFSKPRFTFMTNGFAGKLASATVIILASATIVLGFIPLVDIALMLPIVFFGLGSYTRDGLITGIGWLVLAMSAGGVGFFI